MNRDPEQTRREDVPRYTHENPPGSKEDAEARIQLRNDEIAVIEAHLEHKEVESFSSENEYELWRARAASALGYKKAEVKFLVKWMEPPTPAETPGEREVRFRQREALRQEEQRALAASQEEVERQLTVRITDLVTAIHGRYTRLYSLTNPPESFQKAEERYSFIRGIKDRIEQEFVEVKAAGARHAIGKSRVKKLLFPLHQLAQQTNLEENLLFRFLQGNPTDSPKDQRLLAEQAIKELVHGLADALEAKWALDDDVAEPLHSLSAIQGHLDVLNARRKEAFTAVQTANKACEDAGFVGPKRVNLKMPVAELCNALDQEIQKTQGLNTQLREQQQKEEKEARRKSNIESFERRQKELNDLAGVAQEIRSRVAQTANEIREQYPPLYSREHPPTNFEEAENQLQRVADARRRIQLALSETADAWCRHPLRRGDLSAAKLPLLTILHSLEREAGVIKAFQQTQNTESVVSSHSKRPWKHICIAALTRAMLEGFKLTKEEQETLKEMLSDVASAP